MTIIYKNQFNDETFGQEHGEMIDDIYRQWNKVAKRNEHSFLEGGIEITVKYLRDKLPEVD